MKATISIILKSTGELDEKPSLYLEGCLRNLHLCPRRLSLQRYLN